MMICVDLVDEEDVVMADRQQNTTTQNNTILKKNFNFKKKLIIEVRKHPALYDNKNKLFSNIAKKELIWQKIAKHLEADVDVCKNTWVEMRYGYQCHARRLRNFFLNGHKQNRKRPAMGLELELMFLWRYVDSRKTAKLPFDISDLNTETPQTEVENSKKNSNKAKEMIDDDLILVEQPVECIVIDEDDDNVNGKHEKQFKITPGMKLLVEEIKSYTELYDSDHAAFKDYALKSLIWNGIAYKLQDKATKLMKCWIIMQTRYEWELMNKNENADNKPSELQKNLEFLKDYILKNPDTVYKHSYYLKTAWCDPIDYFKDIYNLIVRMKKVSDIVHITDALLNSREKSKEYLSLWSEIATPKGYTAGQCETTWLIMRHFYWELMYMRKFKYNLADKWYFETIITELYAISKAALLAKHNEMQAQKQNKSNKKLSKARSPTIDINTKNCVNVTINTTKNPSSINKDLQSIPVTTSSPMNIPAFTIPKITSAISLAPQTLNKSPLLVKQIPGPPSAAIQQSVAAPHIQTVNGTVTTPGRSALITTPVQQQQTQPLPIQMPFNLPNQIKVAPVPMTSIPPLIPIVATTQQTVVGGTTPSTVISIRPKYSVKPGLPPTLTPGSTTLNIRPLMTTISQPSIPLNNTSNTTVLTTQPISSSKFITPNSLSAKTASQCTTATSNNPLTVSTSTTSMKSSTTSAVSHQLPKISAAVSLLNPNEILIELIASQNGNHLVVHGPPLNTKYQLSMPTVAKFIREVLGIPLLHNKHHNQPVVVNNYWEKLAQSFNLPVHICRACWNFLLENFNHFPQIAPLKELMRPFPTTFNVWMESTTLFKKFDEHCISMGWLQYMDCLPEVIESIGSYPVLYQDIAKENTENLNRQSDMEALCAWRTIHLRFPKIPPLKEIWKSVKNCFCQYMSDLEFSIENKWPLNWWRALARLKFLVETKYSTNEPFYYIVSNKMVEEIERCAMLEMKMRYNKKDIDVTTEENPVEEIKPETSEKPLTPPEKPLTPPEKPLTPPPVKSPFVISQDIELSTLLTAIQKQPDIFNKSDTVARYEAWKNAAKELNISVTDCLMAFKKAIQNYYAFKKQDPLNHCCINDKYYKKLELIISTNQTNKPSTSTSNTSNNKINVKTPFELNQALELLPFSTDCVFPERFISDINMTSCPSNLVVKNWIYGFGNIYYNTHFNNDVKTKLKNILKKYIKIIDYPYT